MMNILDSNRIWIILLILLPLVVSSVGCANRNVSLKKEEMKSGDETENEDKLEILTIEDNPKDDDTDFNIIFKPEIGSDESVLKSNCYKFYIAYWKNQPRSMEIKELKKVILNPESDITIKRINNQVAVVKRTGTGSAIDDITTEEDIWLLRNGTWMRLGGYSNVGSRVIFLNLNTDEYIDAVIQGGCCDTTSYDVFLGDKDEILRYIQGIGFIGIVNDQFKGKCNNTILLEPYDAMKDEFKPRKIRFDCEKDKFVEY